MADLTDFSRLEWESRFVDRLPGDKVLENHTRAVSDVAYSPVQPTAVTNPKLLAWSEPLGGELGICNPKDDPHSIDILAGNLILPAMKPFAARYGGHQFGHWAGQLGDGRAISLGETLTPAGGRMEFQLKGAGPTPYSRRADGRAVLRSSLREFLCSEAMHFLGVPTTRALSLVATGEHVVRDMFYDGNSQAEPGAVVCRVSPSFLRFGNFQILASSGEHGLLKKLTQLLIQDHYPELDADAPDVYALLLDEICRRTARLAAHWMRVGFVHGVMNTDNMSMLGLTIDYGPYGWLEPYVPDWTPNTTDAQGRRYCFGNQPGIALWNLERLAEALLPLIEDRQRTQQCLALYEKTFHESYARHLAEKLGLESLEHEEDKAIATGMFELLAAAETDFTLFFRGLCDWPDGGSDFVAAISPAFYSATAMAPQLKSRWLEWSRRYSVRRKPNASAGMKKVNPKYVPRNYLAQNAITAAEAGDLSVLDRLMKVLQNPYEDQPGAGDLAVRRPEWARFKPGCSALSCSS
ncbi:MAG: YdiU family protein [Deltaproteobacteria bacterium]|nr:YdiU family protein [Deltaproteobacteria bacterium]